MTFTCLYFSPEVMAKFTRRARRHFVTLIKNGMHQITCRVDQSANVTR